MENLPAAVNVNTDSQTCSRLNTNNPRTNCSICNKPNSEAQNSIELTSNKTTRVTEHHALTERELPRNKTEYNNVTVEGSLDNISDKENNQHARKSDELINLASNSYVANSTTEKNDSKQDSYHQREARNKVNDIRQYLEEKDNYEEFLVPEIILKKKVLLMGLCP